VKRGWLVVREEVKCRKIVICYDKAEVIKTGKYLHTVWCNGRTK